jgi:eukaryotic-like serine/threonine-protein kinase
MCYDMQESSLKRTCGVSLDGSPLSTHVFPGQKETLSMADRVGQQLGYYRLLRVLGQGAFAEVYLGEHLYLERLAAIKVLHVQVEPETQEQFRREARTIAHLQHPHIVRVLDFGLQNQTPFLVLEYIPNGTLRTRHPTGTRLPLEQIVTYVKQIASALDYAHQQRVIHRDVKPENMLLNANDEVVLSDFGIAMVQQTRESLSTQDSAGTPLYMAPEQIRGKPCPASDQYSLAVVVYEWLCGEPPFRGSLFGVYSQHLYQSPPDLGTRVPHLPHLVENVLLVALAKDPHQRYTSVQDFATALYAACFATQPLVSPVLTEREAADQHAPLVPLSAPMATPPARVEDLSGEQTQPWLMPSQRTGDEQEPGQQVTPLSVVLSPTVSKRARQAGTQTNRERLLRKVRAFWIAGVLEHSLHGANPRSRCG